MTTPRNTLSCLTSASRRWLLDTGSSTAQQTQFRCSLDLFPSFITKSSKNKTIVLPSILFFFPAYLFHFLIPFFLLAWFFFSHFIFIFFFFLVFSHHDSSSWPVFPFVSALIGNYHHHTYNLHFHGVHSSYCIALHLYPSLPASLFEQGYLTIHAHSFFSF